VAPPPDRIYTVAAELLTAVVAHHGGSLPERRFVSAGPAQWDCEHVSVWCELTSGQSGDVSLESAQSLRSAAGFSMRAGNFVVGVARETPAVPKAQGHTIVLPSVASQDAAARTLYEDAQRVTNALVAAAKADELPGCNSLALLGWTVVGPEGGYVGGELRIRVGLVRGA
jgi:hypothetical protein